MSSTSLFAELVKSRKNRERIKQLMTKEGEKPEKGKENVEPEGGGSASGPDTPGPTASAASIPNGAAKNDTNAAVDQEEISNPSSHSEQESASNSVIKIDFKKVSVPTSLTKLPMPPGINLEDIDSPTSPSTPPESKPARLSITKDLPMPPSKSRTLIVHLIVLNLLSYDCDQWRFLHIFHICAVSKKDI